MGADQKQLLIEIMEFDESIELYDMNINKRQWERRPTVIGELTDKEQKLLSEVEEKVKKENGVFDWFTAASMIIHLRELRNEK